MGESSKFPDVPTANSLSHPMKNLILLDYTFVCIYTHL